MTPSDLIDDLKSRINPAYAHQIGTESYERRLCVEVLEALASDRDQLIAAIQQTLNENGHLADGDNCTLIVLKRALEDVGAAQIVNCSTCRFKETKDPCRGCWEFGSWQREKVGSGEMAV